MLGAVSDAVLLVAYGSIQTLDDLPDFLARVRRGRPPSEALLAQMQHRYRTIGGSPLVRITRSQAETLAQALGVPVQVGMRFSPPWLRDVEIGGVDRLVVLPMAPFSTASYLEPVRDAIHGPKLLPVGDYGTSAGYVEAWADSIGRQAPWDGDLILSAHSLPVNVGMAYRAGLLECATAIGARLGRPVTVCFQSRGASEGEWLGPDVLEVLAGVGARKVVVAPIGFVAEHLETLYDLDVEAAALARKRGIELCRVPALGTEPAFIRLLARLVRAALDD
jgi:protoporphyrin/coproporphyrin ferrochelatase